MAGASSGISTTTTSEVRNVLATDPAFSSAQRMTLVGSMMPASMRLQSSPVAALYPQLGSGLDTTFSMITLPLTPALDAMRRLGYRSALLMMSAPTRCSSLSRVSLIASTLALSLSRVDPPPITMPSCTAALVALRASSTRSFFSLSSVSVCAPTCTIATPPERRAMRSLSFSFSYSASAASQSTLICFTRASTSRLVEPSPTIVQNSLPRVTRAARPRTSGPALSSWMPSSSLTTVAPVRMAMSSRYWDLRSPKPGALRAHTLREPRSLLTTRVARASCSMSSAMMRRGKPPRMASSSTPTMSRAVEIFLSTRRRRALSYSQIMRSGSVTK
mmetsp:Transcript_69126/g.218680  ORF Transcript_69126/g.218680 Transcript_69126/m.218680 type:complete len:332 (+) Transcript_69126:130-1125(+)